MSEVKTKKVMKRQKLIKSKELVVVELRSFERRKKRTARKGTRQRTPSRRQAIIR